MKSLIRNLLLSFVILFSLTSCTYDKSDYIVVDQGDSHYLLVKGVDQYYPSLSVDNDTIVFSIDNLKVNTKDTYSYKDIDEDTFWDYIVNKHQLDIKDKSLVLIGKRFVDEKPIDAQLIYVVDNGNDWLVYSYSSIIEKNNVFYTLDYSDDKQIINQNFVNKMPAFAKNNYSKGDWTIEKFKQWLDLNSFQWMEY